MNWLAIASMAGSLISSGIGAKFGADANEDAKGILLNQQKAERAENRRLLDRGYVGSSENQVLINRLKELQREQYNRARATNVVAGGTDASLAAMQQAGNKMVTDTIGNIGARADAWEDRVRQQGILSDRAYAQQMFALGQQKAQQIALAAGQASKAMAGIAGAAGSESNPFKSAEVPPVEQVPQVQQNLQTSTPTGDPNFMFGALGDAVDPEFIKAHRNGLVTL